MNFKSIALALSLVWAISSHAQNILADERFPVDYFMVHKNLPHYFRVFREFGDDKNLSLSNQQKAKLQKLQDATVSVVIEKALKVRELELALQKEVVFENKTSKQLQDMLEEIAALRLELTKAHIGCIQEVKKVLTHEQDKFFIEKLGIKQ